MLNDTKIKDKNIKVTDHDEIEVLDETRLQTRQTDNQLNN